MVQQAVQELLPAPSTADVDTIARGGRLYDDWATETGTGAQSGDHPLWATQTTNSRSGAVTWRCKECHGWDYKGAGGAYGAGSHETGFTGVYVAGQSLTKDQLMEILKGAADYRHDFSSSLTNEQLSAIVDFLKNGPINEASYIDYDTGKPRVAVDLDNGTSRFSRTCAVCHGDDGTQINFATADSPEYVGTIATENPWEFIHKVRFSQPGPAGGIMPAAITRGWTIQDILDVLAIAQTLPTK